MLNISDIENWLRSNEINNFYIAKDFSVSVNGNVNLSRKLNGEKIPVKFDRIDGNFDISNNNLTTLEGCPRFVQKKFDCSKNDLESLLDCPLEVGDFDCSNNKIKSLSYRPKEVRGNFDCSYNELNSLKGSPRTIKGYFKCNNNRLSSLEGGPKSIEAYFNCSYNLIETLKEGPILVKKDYICNQNRLSDLDGIAGEIGGDLITDVFLELTLQFDEETRVYRYKGQDAVNYVYKPTVSLTNKEDIKEWLNKFDIKNAKILSDNSVDVYGDVKLSGKLLNMSKLPINFNIVKGDFDISENELSSLEGSPIKVEGNFFAHKNDLSSLRGGPKEVKGSFIVLNNNLTSLQYSPAIVKEDFICAHNPFKTLDGMNTVLGYVFTCVHIPKLKCQKYNYRGVVTYRYLGDTIMRHLDEEYNSLTDEEKSFESTKNKLQRIVKRMIRSKTLTKDLITDRLLSNLTKYHLDDLKLQVLKIKNPIENEDEEHIDEDDIMKFI